MSNNKKTLDGVYVPEHIFTTDGTEFKSGKNLFPNHSSLKGFTLLKVITEYFSSAMILCVTLRML